MATIRSVTPIKGRPKGTVTQIDISFWLSAEEGQLLPHNSQLKRLFGPATRYDSMVRRDSAELVIRYRISDAPFGAANPQEIARYALVHVNHVLATRAKMHGFTLTS